jgi:hypothetical protein
MGEDYQDAAGRHLQDANLLFDQSPPRLANASHLFGISAECSLKAIARQSNPNIRSWKSKNIGSNGHLPMLATELLHLAPSIEGNADLAKKIQGLAPSFADWEVGQRYHPQTTFDADAVGRQQTGAHYANLLMRNVLSGVV